MVAWVISKDADIDSFPGVLLVCGLLAGYGEIFVLREGEKFARSEMFCTQYHAALLQERASASA